MAKNTNVLRVRAECEGFISGLSREFSKQTGFPKNNTATMRRMATRLEGRFFVKGMDFDMAIFGKNKRRKL